MFAISIQRSFPRSPIQKTHTRNLSTISSYTNEVSTKNLRDVLEKGRIHCGISGMSVAVLHKGKLVFAEGFGKRNEHERFTPETLLPIASLTKAFTATAIGELVAEGKMDWDTTPVKSYLPEFELKDPVLTSQLTMVDLLSHRTNFPNAGELAWYKSTAETRDLIKKLRHVNVSPKLGSKCQYSSVMYGVAGEAAANVAGISYEKLVETKVLEPLKLKNTGFKPMELEKISSNHAMGFRAESIEDAQKGLFAMCPVDYIGKANVPAGDLYSNVLDLVRWGKAIMNTGEIDGEQILNKDSVVETLNPHTIMQLPRREPEFSPVLTYGMGWMQDSFKGHTFYWHNGGTAGFASRLDVYPDADLVIAQLCNTKSGGGLGNGVSRYIADEILNLPKTKDWIFDVALKETNMHYDFLKQGLEGLLPERVPNKPASQELKAFEGEYTNPVLGDITVRVGIDEKTEKETLLFKMGPFDRKLEHYHFDSFVGIIEDWNMTATDLATFWTARDGKVEGLRFFEEEFKRKNEPRSSSKETKEE